MEKVYLFTKAKRQQIVFSRFLDALKNMKYGLIIIFVIVWLFPYETDGAQAIAMKSFFKGLFIFLLLVYFIGILTSYTGGIILTGKDIIYDHYGLRKSRILRILLRIIFGYKVGLVYYEIPLYSIEKIEDNDNHMMVYSNDRIMMIDKKKIKIDDYIEGYEELKEKLYTELNKNNE